MEHDSNPVDDRRLSAAMHLLEPEGGKRAPGLLVLIACVGLVVAVMALAGATVLAPKAPPARAEAETSVAASDAAPKADFELSSKQLAPAGSEGSR